jgi:hypothetical protein
VPRGFYAAQIAHWHEHFKPEQLHVACFEDLLQNPGQVLDDVFSFLGLPPSRVDTSKVLNGGGRQAKEPIAPALLAELNALYRRENARLEGLTGRSFRWR